MKQKNLKHIKAGDLVLFVDTLKNIMRLEKVIKVANGLIDIGYNDYLSQWICFSRETGISHTEKTIPWLNGLLIIGISEIPSDLLNFLLVCGKGNSVNTKEDFLRLEKNGGINPHFIAKWETGGMCSCECDDCCGAEAVVYTTNI